MRNKQTITTLIYCFLCKRSGRPVYVGKTTMTLARRISNHIGSAKRKGRTPFHLWLKDNLDNYNIIILEAVNFFRSSKAEIRWMNRLSKRFPLYNVRAYSTGNPGVGRIDWTSDMVDMLGKRTDTEISEILGCCRESVAYKRQMLNIPRLPDPHNTPQRITLDLVTRAKLGTMPDWKLAKEVGCSKYVIATNRKRLNIASYADSTGNNGRIKLGEPHRRWSNR